MKKRTKGILIVVAVIVLAALTAGVVWMNTKMERVDDPKNDPYPSPSEQVPTPTSTPNPEATTPSQDEKDYVGQKSDPGLCKDMQNLVQKKVLPLVSYAGYGQLEKQTKAIAKEGNGIIAKSGEKDQKKIDTMKSLMDSTQRYGKYAGDLKASQQQIITVTNDFNSDITRTKDVCNWK